MATSLLQTITPEQDADAVNLRNFQLCLKVGNNLMLISLCVFIVAILIGYQFNHLVPLPVEIAAHIGSMILPGLFKIGYVMRCVGRKHLGKEV